MWWCLNLDSLLFLADFERCYTVTLSACVLSTPSTSIIRAIIQGVLSAFVSSGCSFTFPGAFRRNGLPDIVVARPVTSANHQMVWDAFDSIRLVEEVYICRRSSADPSGPEGVVHANAATPPRVRKPSSSFAAVCLSQPSWLIASFLKHRRETANTLISKENEVDAERLMYYRHLILSCMQ